jgi:hypothetical protein
MPINATLLETIRAKAETERTDVERELLAAADEQTSGGGDEIDWEKAFQHPRFKQLVADKKKSDDELKKLKDQRAKETEDYRALYEQAQAELEAEKGKSGRADTLESALKKTLESELAGLTAEAKKLIPGKLSVEDQLEWITANRSLLARKPAQSIGAGGGRSMQTTKPVTKELSAEEKQIASLFGYTTEEYIKFKDMGSVDPFSKQAQADAQQAEPEE